MVILSLDVHFNGFEVQKDFFIFHKIFNEQKLYNLSVGIGFYQHSADYNIVLFLLHNDGVIKSMVYLL